MYRNFIFLFFYFFINFFIYFVYSRININKVAYLDVFPSISLSVPYIAKDRLGKEEYYIQIKKTVVFKNFSLKMNMPAAKTKGIISSEDININKFFSYGYNVKINSDFLSDTNCIESPKILKYINKNNLEVIKFGSDFKKLYLSKRLVNDSYCFKKNDLNSLIINFDFFGNNRNFIKINNNPFFESIVDKKKDFTYYSVGILILLTTLFSIFAYFSNIFIKRNYY